LWQLSAEGTTLWGVRGGGTRSEQLYGVGLDGAGPGAVVGAGNFTSSTATFGGVALINAGRPGQ